MKTIGYILLVTGIVLGFYALNMNTSVEVHYSYENTLGLPDRVNNIGLMKDQQNYLLISGVLCVIGIILAFFVNPSDKPIEEEQSSNNNKYEDLERISNLLEKGHITKDEFDVEKQKIMSQSSIKDEVSANDMEKINVIIKEERKSLFGGRNFHLIELLEKCCVTKETAIDSLNLYKKLYGIELTEDVASTTKSLDLIKTYLKPFIDKGASSNQRLKELSN